MTTSNIMLVEPTDGQWHLFVRIHEVKLLKFMTFRCKNLACVKSHGFL